jgi:hypothetical protein
LSPLGFVLDIDIDSGAGRFLGAPDRLDGGRVDALERDALRRRLVGRYDDRVLAIRTTDRCGTRLANQSAACEDIAIERRARQTPRSKKDLPPRSLLFGSVPFRADCCGALKIPLSFAI